MTMIAIPSIICFVFPRKTASISTNPRTENDDEVIKSNQHPSWLLGFPRRYDRDIPYACTAQCIVQFWGRAGACILQVLGRDASHWSRTRYPWLACPSIKLACFLEPRVSILCRSWIDIENIQNPLWQKRSCRTNSTLEVSLAEMVHGWMRY
ncbi:hypothetical protein VTN02DRAFT_498 [Thermoascus thermophilus]